MNKADRIMALVKEHPEYRIKEIAMEIGCSVSYVGHVNKELELGITVNRAPELTDEEARSLRRKYKARWSIADIADYYDIYPQKVHEICKNMPRRLRRWSLPDKIALVRMTIDGYTKKEIGKEMNINEVKVNNMQQRLKKQYRKSWERIYRSLIKENTKMIKAND